MNIATNFEATASNLRQCCSPAYLDAIAAAVEMLCRCFDSGGKLLVFGNGGSASDAQHICGELVGRFLRERRGLPAIALSSNQSVLTAWGNDYSFDTVFERQIHAFGLPGDVAWGISTSGNSENVVRAISVARERGLGTIAMTGQHGGRVAPFADVLIPAPCTETPRVQEVHLATYHAVCAEVEERLFSECQEPTEKFAFGTGAAAR